MANHKSAIKAYKQSIKKNRINKSSISRIITNSKSFLDYVKNKDIEMATKSFNKMQSLISRAVIKNIFTLNKASRKISRLYTSLNTILS
jgi:small subunit ribosomal protein S20